MKVIESKAEPTLTVEFTSREAQIVEQLMYLYPTTTSFGAEVMGLYGPFYDAVKSAGILVLDSDTQ